MRLKCGKCPRQTLIWAAVDILRIQIWAHVGGLSGHTPRPLKGIANMNQIKIVVATLVAVLMLASMGSVADAQTDVDDPTVMTQNLYIGVDLSRILLGESPGAVFQTALASDFPGRATAFAGEVANEQPDLIGLQEVTNIFVVNTQGEVVQNLDYLQVVLGNLQARGLNYEVSSAVVNADVTLPLDLEAGLFARVVDRDVILHNADTTEVSDPIAANFADNFTASVGGFPVEFTRGYTAVDATVGLNTFRFVNTHLEVENAPCATPTGFVICQDSQAAELVSTLASEDLPIVLVGDFNAADGEVAYETIAGDGYLWRHRDRRCCSDNPEPVRQRPVVLRSRGRRCHSRTRRMRYGNTNDRRNRRVRDD